MSKNKLVLFVSGEVGYEILKVTKKKTKIYGVVLDDDDLFLKKIKKLTGNIPSILNSKLSKNYNFLKKINADIFVLGWWKHILSKEQIKLANKVCINCHPSFLPFSRGKHYYFWNFVDNSPAGATIHIVDEKIDHGKICFQTRVKKEWEDNAFSMVKKSRKALINLYKKNLNKILLLNFKTYNNKVKKGTFHFSNEIKKKSRINLNKKYTARELINIIRGCGGFKSNLAYFRDSGVNYYIDISIKKN